MVPLVVPGRLSRLVCAPPLGLELALPDHWPICPAHPHDVKRPARIPNQRLDVGSPTDGAGSTHELAAPQRHRELSPGRVAGARLVVTEGRGIAPPDHELIAVPFSPASHRSRVAGGAVPAAGTRSAPAAAGAAVPNERQRRGWAEVVELVERLEFPHGWPFAAAY
ncbi:MAG: hypothetical protein GIX03_08135 [Candidatus Eremiobacteraeota bacterium]|nr:hypothetical protein [Candidatus Eremiobacteraeota bacterium]